jgi:hypothetical protein
MKKFRPLFFFVATLLIVGMGCNTLSGGGDIPSQPQQNQPQTDPQQDTPEPAVTETPTEEPASPTEEEFFTEEFDVNDNWSYFVVDGSSSS